ncbi:MAG TPA: hypothetical protein VE987_16635, partial [Polyangiaceae bacterium]|nr:hypothetical protein [Polyangiaceae bacterium]
MRAPLPSLLLAAGACAGVVTSRASAEPAAAARSGVRAVGPCPRAAAVDGVLSTMLPAGAPLGAAGATITDLGDEYVVQVGDRSKRYADPTRDCAGRARVAAVFIALAISPDAASPAQQSGTAAPPAPPPPPAPSAPPPPKPPVPPVRPAPSSPPDAALTRGWLRFDVRARLDV